jgi:hypothetical protein
LTFLLQEEQDKEKKKNLLLEKRQQVEAKWQTIQQWEEDLMPQDVRRDMKHMNEVCTVSPWNNDPLINEIPVRDELDSKSLWYLLQAKPHFFPSPSCPKSVCSSTYANPL